jgi:hypothetical protein
MGVIERVRQRVFFKDKNEDDWLKPIILFGRLKPGGRLKSGGLKFEARLYRKIWA